MKDYSFEKGLVKFVLKKLKIKKSDYSKKYVEDTLKTISKK